MINLIITFIFLFFSYILFCILTTKKEFVKIIKKIKININGKSILKIQDDKNNEYIISDGIFLSEKKAVEIWNKVKEDELNYITFYGIHFAPLDYKYNIIDVR